MSFACKQEELVADLGIKVKRSLMIATGTDHHILEIHGTLQTVKAQMLDPNDVVQEATIELVGKCVILVKPDYVYVPQCYWTLIQRIMGSGLAL
ncbi:unnamed protein product [Gongylonema pulchrum]|uniref:POP4 domain-containing protein n=1 Tax=Gongylonema pulchrum TaxID=637853 RepID=A0A183EXW7_9BILA|nr:unnamed protein product [Gongylonema pulchrum]